MAGTAEEGLTRKSLYPIVEIYYIGGLETLAETRAYFPNREEAERFARQFDGERYTIDIHPQPRHGREVFQVHVRHVEADVSGAQELLRLLGTVGERARGAGLDGELLSRRMGRALGEAIATREGPLATDRAQALARLGRLVERSGLGALRVVSATPLVLRVQPLPSSPANDHGRRCGHVAGFLEGALSVLLGRATDVREVDCVGLGNPYCTFLCGA